MWKKVLWAVVIILLSGAQSFPLASVSQENALVLRLRQVISDTLEIRKTHAVVSREPVRADEPEFCRITHKPASGSLFDRMAMGANTFRLTAGMSLPRGLKMDDENERGGVMIVRCGGESSVASRNSGFVRWSEQSPPEDEGDRRSPQERQGLSEGDYDELVPPASVIILVSVVPCLAIVLIAGVMVVSFLMGNHPALKRVIYNFGHYRTALMGNRAPDRGTSEMLLPQYTLGGRMPPGAASLHLPPRPPAYNPPPPEPVQTTYSPPAHTQTGGLYGNIPEDY